MKKLVCDRCGGTEFYYSHGLEYAVLIIDGGRAGGQDIYRCAQCNNTISVERKPSYSVSPPQEVFIPDDENK